MIADSDTNVVFVADTLVGRFPELYAGLRAILTEHCIPLRTIQGTRDVWCRDYMPIQISEDRFVQFRYAPDYLTGKHRHLRADGEIGPSLPFVRNCERSEIVLDGGNLVRWTDRVIVCDKIFEENPSWKPSDLLRALGEVLGVGEVFVIPTEPGDVLDHSDGVVRFAAKDVVLVNDFRIVDPGYRTVMRRVLRRAGLKVVELPYLPRIGRTRGIPPAFGCYLNYLWVGRVIVVPRFGVAEDAEVVNCFRRYFPESDVHHLDCTDLSAEGGILNCATWTVLTQEGMEKDSHGRAAGAARGFIG
jgi:agmatine deiminase